MPDVIVVVADTTVDTPILVTEGGREGPPGTPGKPGITVSPTPPSNPSINDLWLEIPA